MMSPEIKICGLTRRIDAEAVATTGARYGGVILAPGGRRSVTAQHARTLFSGLSLRRVGVFVDAEPDELRRTADVVGLDVVQLHGKESPGEASALRAGQRWQVWKAIRPRSAAEFIDLVDAYVAAVDGILLDGWSPVAPGGTGARFPWEEIAAHRDQVPDDVTLIVAGGLTVANVATAIALLRPAIVDVSSGVESTPGQKDAGAISDFISVARTATHHPVERF